MLVVEPAQRRDMERVRRIAAASLSERYNPEWLEEHTGGDDRILVARDIQTGEVVGFAVARREDGCVGHVVAIAVDRQRRGAGVGSALLRQTAEEMARRGAFRLRLEVRADDPYAQRFYLRHGFQPGGLEPAVYSDGSDAVLMERPL